MCLDHIDLHTASAKAIEIGYTPGVNADTTADIAILLTLGASRRAYEGRQLLRSGEVDVDAHPHSWLAIDWKVSRHSRPVLTVS